jgi:hypothetical protein
LLGAGVAACALLAVGPVGASAADDALAARSVIDVPADAPTVATSPSGASVIAWVAARNRLCTVVQLAGAGRPAQIDGGEPSPAAGGPSGGCVEMPVAAQFEAQRLGTTIIRRDRHMTWGYTGTGTATVELRRRGAVFGAGSSAASPLPGEGADLRFFAIEHPAGPVVGDSVPVIDGMPDLDAVVRPDELVLHDASGAVRGASDLIEPRPVDGRVLQHGRRGKARWVLGQKVTHQLAPTPLDPLRRETRRCLEFRSSDGSTRSTGDINICDGDPDGQPYLLQAGGDCLLGGRLEVLVRAPARRVEAILGDGRRRAVPLVSLSPDTRVGTLILGPGVAVRRTVALSAAGQVLATQPMGLPPQPRHGCLESVGFLASVYLPPPTPALGAGPLALQVTDHGERICVAVGRAAHIPEECALPPVDPHRTWLTVRRTSAGRVIYGVVPAEIAAVRVTREDGGTQTIASASIVGYGGRYAAVLRQFAVDLPGGTPVAEVAALDARGRVLRSHAGAEDVPLQRPRTVLRVPGVPPLRVGDASRGLDRGSCLWLGSPMSCTLALSIPASGEAGGYLAQVEASCTPRRIVVLAVLLRRADRLVVRTASGREVAAHRARIPAGSGPLSGLYAQLAVVGPREGIAALVRHGPSGNAITPTPLPPAARQCGYTVLPDLG